MKFLVVILLAFILGSVNAGHRRGPNKPPTDHEWRDWRNLPKTEEEWEDYIEENWGEELDKFEGDIEAWNDDMDEWWEEDEEEEMSWQIILAIVCAVVGFIAVVAVIVLTCVLCKKKNVAARRPGSGRVSPRSVSIAVESLEKKKDGPPPEYNVYASPPPAYNAALNDHKVVEEVPPAPAYEPPRNPATLLPPIETADQMAKQ